MALDLQQVINIFIKEVLIINKKQIEGFDNYFIFKNGTIQNSRGKNICEWKDNVGYLQVKLSQDGKWYYRRVHRLVAKAFIDNPNNLPQVNHIDGDKTNNNINNLEWIDNKHNTQHGNDSQLYHSKHRCIEIQVYNKKTNELLHTYKSIRETAERLHINRKTLSRILFDNKENNYDYNFKAIC